LWAGLIFSVIGIIERFWIPTEWQAFDLGIGRYYRELIGIDYGSWYLGLPENYWRGTPIGRLRRAVSVYGSSQGFALAYLLMFPVSAYGLLHRRLPESRLATVTFLVSLVALGLTITRFTFVVCVGLFLLMLLISNARARRFAKYIVTIMAVGFAMAYVLSDAVRAVVITTINFQDHSSAQRLDIWWSTLLALVEQPLGYGLATVGHTVHRLVGSTSVVGTEGQISKIAIEVGIPGVLIYSAALTMISLFLFVGYRYTSHTYSRALCLCMSLAFLGLWINSLTTEWHNSPSIVYPAWWLAGSCISYILHERASQRAALNGRREVKDERALPAEPPATLPPAFPA
jgi:hypothetical protein